MEGLKGIAVAYYKGGTAKDLDDVTEFFKKLDTNGDGKISFQALQDSGIISNDSFFSFNKFDINYDGVLDLEEIMTIYFLKYSVGEFLKNYEPATLGGSRKCMECCTDQNSRPAYSCFWCMHNSNNKNCYDLCRGCYASVVHKHPLGLISDQSLDLLNVLKDVLFDKEKELDGQAMRNLMAVVDAGATAVKVLITAAALACSLM